MWGARSRHSLPWISWSILASLLPRVWGGCPHPPLPAAANYVNVTGGLDEESWHVRYICNIGEEREGGG